MSAGQVIGLPQGLISALIWGETHNRRYGKPGSRHDSLAQFSQEPMPVPSPPFEIKLRAMQIAVALDLDDPITGKQIQLRHEAIPGQPGLWWIDLIPQALVLTAIRTGLFLPGSVRLHRGTDLTASVTCHTRSDVAALSWQPIRLQVRSADYADCDAQGRPTGVWKDDPERALVDVAEALAAVHALRPMLDHLPCCSIRKWSERSLGELLRPRPVQLVHRPALSREKSAPEAPAQGVPPTQARLFQASPDPGPDASPPDVRF